MIAQLVKLRYATQDDFDFIVQGLKETHIIEKWPEENLVPTQEKKEAKVAIQNKWIRIAQDSGKSVGFLWFDPAFRAMHLDRDDYLWLHLIFIAKEWRNKGVGKILIKDLEKIAKKHKRKELMFDVFEVNTNSASFFKKLGVKPVYTIYSKSIKQK